MASDVTVRSALQAASRMLAQAGIADAARDARRLLEHVLSVDAATLIRDADETMSASTHVHFDELIGRRAAREPVSRILGVREFYGRPFIITPDVLDPRPDTETLIELVLTILGDEGWTSAPITILDLGTGSGAILLTLLNECPAATGTGTDVSTAALAVAARNAASLGVADRATLIAHDTRSGLPPSFDLVVANPPYIPSPEIDLLDTDVAAHDPHLALDGGPDGLDFYRLIIAHTAAACAVSRKPHWLVLEVGAGQAEQVVEIAQKYGIADGAKNLRTANDLGGHIRCVALRTRSR